MRLGKFEILQELGRGGFGTVYQARDLTLERTVALKVLHPQLAADLEFVHRFQREARNLAQIDHPRVVTIYEIGEIDGRIYIAMRYLPGGSLSDRLKASGPIPPDEAVRLLDQVAQGLHAGHRRGIIHRDVKPGNILFDEDGQAVIADFGVARAVQVSSIGTSSESGGAVGTPHYRPPELWRGSPPPSPASDVYSLACVCYEMLTGQLLFSGDTPDQVLTSHVLDDAAELLSREGSSIPRPVRAVLVRALSKDQAARFQSVTDFTRELSTALAQPAVSAAVEPLVISVKEPPREEPVLTVAQSQATTTGEKNPATPAPNLPSQNPRPLPAAPRKGMSRPVLLGIGVTVVLSVIFALWWGNRAGPTPPVTQPIPTATTLPVTAPTDAPVLQPTDLPTESATNAPTLAPTSAPTSLPTSTPAPNPEPGYGETRVRDKDGMVQVYVPAGTFTMGSDIYGDEKPVHEVYLDAYWIDKLEVTQAQYEKCSDAGACEYNNSNRSRQPSYADHPAVYVTWAQANAYCLWAGGRLPTEAEWEKAARGDQDTRVYPWGEGLDPAKANYWGVKGDTVPVGNYPDGASPYGVLDMAGNVWEWVADWYAADYYANSPASNPSGPAAGDYRVLRGGSWFSLTDNLRVSNRNLSNPGYPNHDVGFRCVASP